MRDGKPSIRFGARGLHQINLGGDGKPLLMKLYDANDKVIAELTEVRGDCIDPGYVDFFLGKNCRPAKYHRHIIERLPDGSTNILHDNPKQLAANFPAWVAFLDEWVSKHEKRLSLDAEESAEPIRNSPKP